MFILSTPRGLKQARSIKRLVPSARWSIDTLKWVKYTPWFRYKGDSAADGDNPEDVDDAERGDCPVGHGEAPREPQVVYRDVREKVPREFQIRWEDRQEFGATENCPGCRSWDVGRSRAKHDARCKARMAKFLEGKRDTKMRFRRKPSLRPV